MSMILLDVLEHFELTWLDSLSHGPDSFTHYAWRSSIVSTASKEKRTKSVLKALKQLDESKMSGFHLKTVFTAGMGFFADAYDLFIIGVVSSLLKSLWHLNTFEISLLSSTALFAAAVSAIIFGREEIKSSASGTAAGLEPQGKRRSVTLLTGVFRLAGLAQPERDMLRLHRLLHHVKQLLAQFCQVELTVQIEQSQRGSLLS